MATNAAGLSRGPDGPKNLPSGTTFTSHRPVPLGRGVLAPQQRSVHVLTHQPHVRRPQCWLPPTGGFVSASSASTSVQAPVARANPGSVMVRMKEAKSLAKRLSI